MKHFQIVIVVMLFAFSLKGDARKICILYEPSVTTTEESINNAILDVKEDMHILNGTDELSEVTEETETETEEAEIPVILNGDLKSSNVCALEGITLFDDQNVRIS